MNLEIKLKPWQKQAIFNPYDHFAMFAGVACGKTYTGAHFSILNSIQYPKLTGFIGANDYNQLSQVALRELFFWLEEYQIPFVVDRIPPTKWTLTRSLKTYKNVLSLYIQEQVVTIFTRVLSDPDALRGLEFSWYWIDETRDTQEETHDEILKRLRESNYVKGLTTTTTNGEDWVYKRFVLGADEKIYGSMHVPTIESVNAGLISDKYYQTMLKTFSPLLAEQELFAKHVNVRGGRAYYGASDVNKCYVSPWGDEFPDQSRPLIVGCDFNFQPAPCVWMVGQLGPNEYSDCIHWFGEISHTEVSTIDMTRSLMSQYPDFFYKIYGDASGTRGTTSNAGETDYNQISQTLADAGCLFTIDVDQANPLVKDRVENMNALFKNALGEIRQTYNPQTCPLFDADLKMVGWKKLRIASGQGKLDDAGDSQRTHASDGAGYACFKLFPPSRRGYQITTMESPIRQGDYLTL